MPERTAPTDHEPTEPTDQKRTAPTDHERTAPTDHIETVRSAFACALRGDLGAVSRLLAEDVRWHAAGFETGGCQNRDQALEWMRQALALGRAVEVVDVRAMDEERVLVLLQRTPQEEDEVPDPHGQIVRFRGDEIAEIIVYPSPEDAVKAAAGR